MSSKAQIQAQKRYAKVNQKNLVFCLNRKTDADIIEFFSQQENKLAKFKQLVRDDIMRSANDHDIT